MQHKKQQHSQATKLFCLLFCHTINFANLGVGEGIVKTVSRQDGGFPVDVVQCYLNSRQCSVAHTFPAESEDN